MSRQHGFSIYELAITLVVLAILIALASPSMGDFLRRNRVAASTNSLLHAINYARAEALRGGYAVTLCPTADGASCLNATNWSGRDMLAVRDSNRTGAPAVQQLLQVFDGGSGQLTVTAPAAFVRFLPNGRVQSFSGNVAENNFSIVPDGCQANERRDLHITRMGRVRKSEVSCT